ncbi:hypothetical protein Dimus_001400 [Dionaea muscipula]
MGKGGGHIDARFQVLLGKMSGESGAGPSGVQKKKITRKKKEKATTEVAVGEEEKVSTEGAVDGDEEIPEGAVGENELEVEAEDSDEDTQIIQTSVIPFVSEEGQQRRDI